MARSFLAQAAKTRPYTDSGTLGHLFPRQLDAVRDERKFKALLCGGRAGKTTTAIYELAHGMLSEPGSANLYVGQTLTSARDIFWRPFCDANDRHGWGFSPNHALHTMEHGNGSWLLCAGAETERELEKRRGVPWRRVRIDECGAHRPTYLQYFVEQVIEPRLMDHDGDLWLMGTPTRQSYGYFYDITTGAQPGWGVHKWTAAENPHVKFEAFVAEMLERRGWTRDNPIFRREYLAEWIADVDALVYRFLRGRNVIGELPQLMPHDSWARVMGLDFGVGDATAAVVLAYPRSYGRAVYVQHCWSERGLAPSDAVEKLRPIVERFKPEVIVGDVGGMGKAYQAEWNKRIRGIEMRAANKSDKRGTLEFVSDALHTAVSTGDVTRDRGLLSLDGNEHLHREWATLQWDEDRQDIAEGQDDDVADAAMYAWKACPAYANAIRPPEPEATVSNTTHEYRRRAARQEVAPEHRDLATGWRRR